MPQSDEPTTPMPNSNGKPTPKTNGRKHRTAAADRAPSGLVSFTINTATGKVVSLERVDEAGERHPLTVEEKAKLARAQHARPLKQLMEEAFEAGIEFVLGEEAGSDAPESKEEGELSGILIKSMMQRSKINDLITSDTLDRSVIGTLIVRAGA